MVAQKSKGMPLISVNLSKLLDVDAAEVIAKFSVGLFEAYKGVKESIAKGLSWFCVTFSVNGLFHSFPMYHKSAILFLLLFFVN